MRILHLAHFERMGGVESLVRAVLPVIEQRGHENIVAYGGEPLDMHAMAPPTQRRLPCLDGPPAVAALQKFIAEQQPDVACVHSWIDPPLTETLLDAMPTVFFAHGYGGVCPGGGRLFRYSDTVCNLVGVPDIRCLVNAYTKGCNTRRPTLLGSRYRRTHEMNEWLRSAAAVLCGSQYMADRYAESGVPPERIVVIPLPSPMALQAPRESVPDEPIVLFVGRLAPEKGVTYLLEAFQRLSGRAQLVLCGTGEELPHLQALAGRLGIAESVTFLGACDSLSTLYQRASVVVIPSVWPEPFGLVGPEAMAHGVPVVAFRVGGIPEWLSHGDGGFLVDPKDVVGMAERIQYLLDDPELALRMGRRALEIARVRFNIELFADRFLDVLQRSRAYASSVS